MEDRLARLDQQLTTGMHPFEAQVERLCGIPGVDLLTAWTLLAELGIDMSVFPDAAHAVSWAGLCPGNRESAGKRLSSRMRRGNRWMRRALCQSAWAVTRKRDCHLTALFYRMSARSGVKKAIVAVAHQILLTAFSILRDRSEYRELGGDFFDRQHPQRTQNRLVRRLERLGLQVVITFAKPLPDPAAPARLAVVPAHVSNAESIVNTSGYKLRVFEGPSCRSVNGHGVGVTLNTDWCFEGFILGGVQSPWVER